MSAHKLTIHDVLIYLGDFTGELDYLLDEAGEIAYFTLIL